jgi:3-hydroxybutyryl-CoA dehydrogenase
MEINTICICGAGTMGSGIAQVSAMAGFHTIVYEVNKEVLENAKITIVAGLQILVEKNKLSLQKKQQTIDRILFTNDLQLCLADVFIEAIVEKADFKVALFNQLAELNHSETIFASNTSSLSISAIAKKINNPQRVAGLHFFNPAPIMKLVEVVKGKQTDEAVIQRLVLLTKELGKLPVVCKDSPGFIVNRVARPFYIESLRLTEEGISNLELVDRLLESRGFKLGPFKLMDLIGNDINYAVSCSVYDQLGKPERLRPSPIQKEKVDNGELGRKTKKGYYRY